MPEFLINAAKRVEITEVTINEYAAREGDGLTITFTLEDGTSFQIQFEEFISVPQECKLRKYLEDTFMPSDTIVALVTIKAMVLDVILPSQFINCVPTDMENVT